MLILPELLRFINWPCRAGTQLSLPLLIEQSKYGTSITFLSQNTTLTGMNLWFREHFYGRFHRPLALLIHHWTLLSSAVQVRSLYGSFPAFLLVLLCLLTFVYHVRNYGCISDGYLDGLVSIIGSPIFHTLNIQNPASNLMPICDQVAPGKSKMIFTIKNK